MTEQNPYFITTPIYYVNDRPHIGHCYTTLVADTLARFQRASGRDVFFLTGTDEHAEKVVESARANGMSPIEWADRNAAAFREAFAFMGFSHDDFIRTTEERHTGRVERYIRALMEAGHIYLGDYVGWYDTSQDEYLTESVAKEHDYKSPVTGKPLTKRTEKNYFFRLSAFQDRLRAHIDAHPGFIRPEARWNEVLGRLNAPGGLQDVPVSRAVDPNDERSSWGILMPGDPGHRVYVWIDALFNYISAVDAPGRERVWPATVHVMAKDILWFHAVIWPCLLMALERPLPGCVYAHSFWIREGRKMSKSLGNFLDLETIRAYAGAFSVDALRWYLLTQGPLGATDADFVHAKFVEVYNADLANGIGNASSRVSNMIEKYFGGVVPEPLQERAVFVPNDAGFNLPRVAESYARKASDWIDALDLGNALQAAIIVCSRVDGNINRTEPFKLAKDPANLPLVGTILHHCAEAIRIAAVLLSPAMPQKMGELLERMGQEAPDGKGRFSRPLEELCKWGGLKPGTRIVKGEPLFPRADPAAAAPVAG